MESLKQILSNKKYFAPACVFASINFIMGTWVLYLPHIKIKFLLNDEQIGEALFFLALGFLLLFERLRRNKNMIIGLKNLFIFKLSDFIVC